MRISTHVLAATLSGGLLGMAPLAVTPAGAATPATPAVAARAAAPSGISAKGAYLYDSTNGAKLWGRSTTTKRPIGSITKVMTAILVIKAGKLDRTVTVKKSWVDHVKNTDAASAGLHTGEKVTVRQLLYGTMLPSGCDAAYGLADLYGPTPKKFIAKMNKKAAALGMKSTYFRTTDGLPTSSHKEGYSTPNDLIKLARYAMTSSTFRTIVSHQTYKLSKTGGHRAHSWSNTNLLLGSYSGATGIKTGSTDAAGYCLLFAAERDGRTLIGVVLHSTADDSKQRFRDAAAMLDWGFGQTTTTTLRLRSLPPGAPTD